MELRNYLIRECEALENKGGSEIDSELDLTLFSFRCHPSPDDVIRNIKEVLLTIDKIVISQKSWPTIDEWGEILPVWFTSKFHPDRTESEKQKFIVEWQSKKFDEKDNIKLQDSKWRLKNWIYYFEVDKRDFFFESFTANKNTIHMTIASMDLPFSIGPVEWLIRASGGYNLKEID
jgi:hypothetical protein